MGTDFKKVGGGMSMDAKRKCRADGKQKGEMGTFKQGVGGQDDTADEVKTSEGVREQVDRGQWVGVGDMDEGSSDGPKLGTEDRAGGMGATGVDKVSAGERGAMKGSTKQSGAGGRDR